MYRQKKNIDAPLAWILRNIKPFQDSYIMELTELKANRVSGVYRNAKNKPEIIWIIKHRPNIDPKFQNKLILIGVGKLIKELFNKEIKKWGSLRLNIYFNINLMIE